jgi:hypothetical protein
MTKAVRDRQNKKSKNNPMHSSQVVEITALRLVLKSQLCGIDEMVVPSGKTGA